MTTDDLPNPAWFMFAVQDADEAGIEIPKLTRLLSALSSAFYAIARGKKGAATSRPGRRAVSEERLANFRLVRISPGSTVIELAPPAGQEQLMFPDEPTSEDVMIEFYREVGDIESAQPPTPERWEIRQGVRAVLEDAAQIGSRAEIGFKTGIPRPGIDANREYRRTFNIRSLPEPEAPARSVQRRRLFGHAYMVDVEPGRQRVRIKLPDGKDLTVDVDDDVVDKIRQALDQPVELDVEEQAEGSKATRRLVRDLSVLPSSGEGGDQPPKTIGELETEQNLPSERPDYVGLATSIWPTKRDVEEFLEELRALRRAATSLG